MVLKKLNSQLKEKICGRLMGCDPDIVEIIQFGSSVYAPKYARDLDLLIITRAKKDDHEYLNCLDTLDLPFDVDIIVCKAGEKLKNSLASQILGSYELLYGSGEYISKIRKHFDPNFEEARSYLRGAKEDLELARKSKNKYDKDRRIKSAFNQLFHTARIASMTFLSLDEARWGKIRRRLPQPYRDEFEDYINILHLRYFYQGEYAEEFEQEFTRWSQKVENFVESLQTKSQSL